ncbi:hypothetical protein [Methylobacterium sp. J-090]|uniref:hypothetical protein n=1 Tax=Methylobacterium sp. J-090 TaxID=2836666 RepID=UPI001FBBBBA8|nr:hypothetical protein [Methylobacterium sp. J-090]MCJ2081256.1 hypothetical protein [Methylobacterium sp. J-090]
MALFGLGRRQPPADGAMRGAILAWTRAAAGLGADGVVKVNEIVCADPACPGMETILLLMPPGRPTRAVKIAKPMAEVTEGDVILALVRDERPVRD